MKIPGWLVPLLFSAGTLLADAPLPPPAHHATESSDKKTVVISDPKEGTLCKTRNGGRVLWRTNGWFRSIFLSDDGIHMVTAYDGLNLIPVNHRPEMTILTFWKNGKIFREVPLKELVPEKESLLRTVSHYEWGSVAGVSKAGKLQVNTADGRKLEYDFETGLPSK
ncbi:MAG: hypothetical protein KF712_18000 [Akkermansiaceae bacterium]|nr:hypothetical protein [Akkermansiaceae bacterium]